MDSKQISQIKQALMDAGVVVSKGEDMLHSDMTAFRHHAQFKFGIHPVKFAQRIAYDLEGLCGQMFGGADPEASKKAAEQRAADEAAEAEQKEAQRVIDEQAAADKLVEEKRLADEALALEEAKKVEAQKLADEAEQARIASEQAAQQQAPAETSTAPLISTELSAKE